MMSADELRTLCSRIRALSRAAVVPDEGQLVTEALVRRIETDVRDYRTKFLTRPAPQLPSEPLRELLPLMGWLIYEASLDRLWDVETGFDALPAGRREKSEIAAGLIRRLANAARRLVWPEFAGRALGAIRAEALVASKLDTEEGFDTAWILHDEADQKYLSFKDTFGNNPQRAAFVVLLDEVFLQLALGETGTACRTAERVIGRWAEDFTQADPEATKRESEDWTQKLFPRLVEGIKTGERALATAHQIKKSPGFVHQVTAERLTLPTGLRNPAIMTCRAILLAYSLCPEMDRLRRMPPAGCETWATYQHDLLQRFDQAFPALLEPVAKADGSPWPLNPDHQRSLVQLCLHLALVTARHRLPQQVRVDDELTLHILDDESVEAMSRWLAAAEDDANIVGSSSKPDFNSSVEACRKDAGAAASYRDWRCRWPQLDRYADEDGRRERIAGILGRP